MQPLMLATGDEEIVMIAMTGGFFIAAVAIVTSFMRAVLKTRAREQTKREIAAYIAEGSMTPADGERLIRADIPHWEKKEA